MSTVLLATIGTQGVVNLSHEMVRRLEVAGHDVVVICDKDVGAAYEVRGTTFRQLPEAPPHPTEPWPAGGRFGRRRRLRAEAAARLNIPAFEEALDEIRPDLVIIEVEYHEWIVAATKAGIPVVVLHQMMCGWRAPGSPPIDDALPTGGASPTRAQVDVAWLKRVLHRVRSRTRARLRESTPTRPTLLRAYARAVRFPRREWSSLTAWPEPFHYRTLPIVLTTLQDIDTARPRDGVVYVGPMIEAARVDRELPDADRDAIDAALQRARAQGRPVVLSTVTTMGDGQLEGAAFYGALAAAVPEAEFLIGAGVEDLDLPDLAPNLTIVASLPVARLLPEAAVMINHAGINSINEGIAAGVPLVLRPGHRHDQPGAAARMAATGSAEVVHAFSSPEELGAAVKRCLSDPAIADRAARLATACAAAADERRLERLVESEIARGPRIRL